MSKPQSNTNPALFDQPTNRDVVFAIGIIIILAVLFLPIPSFLIDFGLAMSIAFSVLILMVALWIQKPLDFSSFPLILLIATMLRLSLNISTTRLILSEGHNGPLAAGSVIYGFSNFVMGSDFVIGMVVFVILVTVNFIVITKGASRIAEVGARFTLDAIPGKQMAIDADLSAGLLDEKEAQEKRRELEEESSFFGSMDGASKFVRGDAIAGLIITGINIIGGIIIGVWRHQMEFTEALDVFTKLSVGDGLVSQIPALIISLAAGLLVSKGGTRGSADMAVLNQLSNYPKALYVSAGLLAVFAVAPGLPMLPFIMFALVLAFAGYIIPVRAKERDIAVQKLEADRQSLETAKQNDTLDNTLKVPPIELAMGKQLSAKLLAEQELLSNRMAKSRMKFAKDYGFVIPEIKLTSDFLLGDREYRIKVFGTQVGQGSVSMLDVLVIAKGVPPKDLPVDETTDPVFGAKAWSVPDIYSQQLKELGYRPIDGTSQILTHVNEVVKNSLAQLFTYKDMRQIIANLEKEYSRLVDEICPTHLSFSGLQSILKNLLAERVSVRNINLILEAVAEIAPYSKRMDQITEHVRTRLAQQICGEVSQNGRLKIIQLGNKWEQLFDEALQKDQRGEIADFRMQPDDLKAFGESVKSMIDTLQLSEVRFAMVVPPQLRTYMRMVMERLHPSLPVLSNLEIARGFEVEVLGTVSE